MRNLRLLATVLFVAVLLVGIVLLLRQTNVQNDTSVTSTQVTSQQLAVNTTAQTDPPIRVSKAKGAKISNGVQPVRTQLENSKGASARTSSNQAELTPIDGLSISSSNLPTVTRTQRTAAPTVTKSTSWNPNASKAEQIRSLEQMLREEPNPKAKAKIQHKLNSIK